MKFSEYEADVAIDFSQIKPYKGSQHDAFEELVCQIVRRTIAEGNDTWRRLDGSGGDGGVEAFWYRESEYKIGVQAKFFTSTSDIDWSQIIHSFKTAVNIHGDLKEYRIYIACDLTGPTVRKGLSGTQKWENTLATMRAHANSIHREIEIVLNTASDLLGMLSQPACVGLIEHWFGEVEITSTKMRNWLDSSIKALGDRFHPEDHVEVDAQELFRVLNHSENIKEKLLADMSHVLTCDRLSIPQTWQSIPNKVKTIEDINKSIDNFIYFLKEIDVDSSTIWPIKAWREHAETLRRKVQDLIYASYQSGEKKTDGDFGITSFRLKAESINLALGKLLLFSKTFDSEASRTALIIGDAGSGKSHLLSAAAKEIIEDQGICVLFLGQRFHRGDIWTQIAEQLGFHNTPKEKLLGALDAAASASGKRGLIIIDALNEGTFGQWRNELENFIDAIRAFANLAIVVSCRDVYMPYVITDAVRQRFPTIEVKGFETEEEQEAAARVYLDKRGISRPPVPWLAPEFINPLFLRSVCIALNKVGKKEFPAGLHGTKQLLAFYIETIAQNLGTAWDGGTDLILPCKRALLAVAKAMAEAQKDWLEQDVASAIINSSFVNFPSQGNTWLKVLIQNDVLREDPYPEDPIDPLNYKPDVVRFAFQRFQDHLMAEALLDSIINPSAAFLENGPLTFILWPKGEPRWMWQGLIEALSIQIPEKFGMELVDVLPGGFDHQWTYWNQRAFVQSVKWREYEAITDRTFELACYLSIQEEGDDLLTLLIELAPQANHPWNAELLDKNLRRWKLPDRDKEWTIYISTQGLTEKHPINRLIDWCMDAPKSLAETKVLYLSSLTLCWLLTSSASFVRDRATKALATLFTDKPNLFGEMLRKFYDVDDLYVVERILAAGYGTLLRFPDNDKAFSYAEVVWGCFFGQENIPPNLLLRDYARGIIDISAKLNSLPSIVEIAKVYPPYPSKRINLNITEEMIKKTAEKADGQDILRSCGEWGDFQRYEVGSTVDTISKVPLTASAPYTCRQLAYQFEKEIDQDGGEKKETLMLLDKLIRKSRSVQFYGQEDASTISYEIDEGFSNKEVMHQFKTLESCLLSFLTEEQKAKYYTIWLPEKIPSLKSKRKTKSDKVEIFTSLPASRWIASRAYGLGWTKKRFGNDIGYYENRNRPKVERIGKKYQWIARSELISRLVDHYWLFEEWDYAEARCYDHITDLSFERDIDPTLFSGNTCINGQAYGKVRKLITEITKISPLDGEERLKWPFQDDPGSAIEDGIRVTDRDGIKWYRLTWHTSTRRKNFPKTDSFGHGTVQREFAFANAVLCRLGIGQQIATLLQGTDKIDIQDWDPPVYTDGPFLYEVVWRSTWPKQQWHSVNVRFQHKEFEIAFPVEEYQWESHLDSSLPEGAHASVLAGWLMDSEKLYLDSSSPQLIVNSAGEIVAWSTRINQDFHNENGLYVKAEWFDAFLKAQNLECIWITTGEREAWNDGAEYGATTCRRFNCISLLSEGKISVVKWNEDYPDGLGTQPIISTPVQYLK